MVVEKLEEKEETIGKRPDRKEETIGKREDLKEGMIGKKEGEIEDGEEEIEEKSTGVTSLVSQEPIR